MHRFEIPNRVITDLGSPFTAIKFRNWAHDCGISTNYASVAHSEANGQVKRANGLILAGLKPMLYEELEDYCNGTVQIIRAQVQKQLPKRSNSQT
jgi:hypothetical protein